MRKMMIVIVMALICTTGCTIGPAATDTDEIVMQTDSAVGPAATQTGDIPQTDSTEDTIQNCLDTYYEFLNGEISVSHCQIKSNMYNIDDIFRADENHNRFTFYDSNDNGIPELHLSSMRSYYVIECVNDALVMLYSGSGYETLLNNGAILYTRYGGAPDHISYKYIELDSDNKIFETTFEEYNGDMEGDYDYFLLNGEEVTKSEFDAIAEKYLNIGSDGIIWSDYSTFLFENTN